MVACVQEGETSTFSIGWRLLTASLFARCSESPMLSPSRPSRSVYSGLWTPTWRCPVCAPRTVDNPTLLPNLPPRRLKVSTWARKVVKHVHTVRGETCEAKGLMDWCKSQIALFCVLVDSLRQIPSEFWPILNLWIIVDFYYGLIQPASHGGYFLSFFFGAFSRYCCCWWWGWQRRASLRYGSDRRGGGYMETGLTCRGRSCHYLRAGRKPETLMEKSITLTTLTSAPAGSTPETGRMRDPLTSCRWPRLAPSSEGWGEALQRWAGLLPDVLPLAIPAGSKVLQCVAMEMDMCPC